MCVCLTDDAHEEFEQAPASEAKQEAKEAQDSSHRVLKPRGVVFNRGLELRARILAQGDTDGVGALLGGG
jgi:hypothetical protein